MPHKLSAIMENIRRGHSMRMQASITVSLFVILAGAFLMAMTASGGPIGSHGALSGTVLITGGLFRLGKIYLRNPS